jgi:uncharacterized protein YbjT (DUF2867 family)
MPISHAPVLVTGATGRQGGAAARHLRAAGFRVRALVRNPAAATARELAQAGADLVCGDMTDLASLDAAMRGAYGVFSVQPTKGSAGTSADFHTEDEVRMGVTVAEAARRAGVRHVVYTSVGGVERAPEIRRWQSKARIEAHLEALGLPTTVLRPVRFMENLYDPRAAIRDGVLTDVFHPDVPVQLIAADDIGAFAALAFADPDHYLGRAVELAGDELTMPRIAAAVTEATGRPVVYQPLPRAALVDLDPDAVAGYDFGNGGGWQADIPALRELRPELTDFATWLSKADTAAIFHTPPDEIH